MLVTLADRGERFHIWVTEPTAAQILVDIRDGRVAFTNVTGPLRNISGVGRHNSPWSWHLDPAQILVDIQTFAAVYSGTPSEVEADLVNLLALGRDKMTSNHQGAIVSVEDRRSP